MKIIFYKNRTWFIAWEGITIVSLQDENGNRAIVSRKKLVELLK
jgi:hypothetical protein